MNNIVGSKEAAKEYCDRFPNMSLVENLNKKGLKEYYDEDLDESLKVKNQLNQLKESLGSTKFNKIQTLIKERLKEGMEVEITIPKNRK